MHLPLRFAAAAVCLVLAANARADRNDADALTFDLEEVSAFETPGRMHSLFVAGHRGLCVTLADPNIRKYPAFASADVLDGNEETFTITVAYDTKELYGTVKASREFSISRQ